MLIFTEKKKLREYLDKNTNRSIGFIPTMGALHEGHISLVKKSLELCEISVCSIFVNPKQFNRKKDFTNYPVSIQSDLKFLSEIKCDAVYMPSSSDLYKKNEKIQDYNLGRLTKIMEGEFRSGHFNGVITVVKKFLDIIQPTHIFFGEKDLQQLQIIKFIVKQEALNIEVIQLPTIREKNGLAMSSRNKLLNDTEKEKASLIYTSLIFCKNQKEKLSIQEMKKKITQDFKKSTYLELEYLEFIDLVKFQETTNWERENAICISAHLNNVRLIDNIIL